MNSTIIIVGILTLVFIFLVLVLPLSHYVL